MYYQYENVCNVNWKVAVWQNGFSFSEIIVPFLDVAFSKWCVIQALGTCAKPQEPQKGISILLLNNEL